MKKAITLLSLLFLITFSVFAQDAPKRTEEYCQLVATSKPFSSKVIVQVDYGQETKFFGGPAVVKDEAGKAQNFNSVVDALNHMNGQGWEFVNAYVITVSNQNVYHYLMKRKINT